MLLNELLKQLKDCSQQLSSGDIPMRMDGKDYYISVSLESDNNGHPYANVKVNETKTCVSVASQTELDIFLHDSDKLHCRIPVKSVYVYDASTSRPNLKIVLKNEDDLKHFQAWMNDANFLRVGGCLKKEITDTLLFSSTNKGYSLEVYDAFPIEINHESKTVILSIDYTNGDKIFFK